MVFQGAPEHVQYVRRAQPGMVVSRDTGLWSPPADEPAPVQPAVQVGMNTGYISAAAPVSQVLTLNVPAGGVA